MGELKLFTKIAPGHPILSKFVFSTVIAPKIKDPQKTKCTAWAANAGKGL